MLIHKMDIVKGLFEGVNFGNVLEATRGADVDRMKYISGMINGLEEEGYVVTSFDEDGRVYRFHLKERRRNQNA